MVFLHLFINLILKLAREHTTTRIITVRFQIEIHLRQILPLLEIINIAAKIRTRLAKLTTSSILNSNNYIYNNRFNSNKRKINLQIFILTTKMENSK